VCERVLKRGSGVCVSKRGTEGERRKERRTERRKVRRKERKKERSRNAYTASEEKLT
jgi:hypothetical protein